jgi:hypothetical protein
MAIRFPAIMHIEKMENIMKYFISTALAATLVVAAASVALADNPNWSEEKAAQVDANRNSDAGIGNGGERLRRNGTWGSTTNGEDGGQDVDPGNSSDHNQACTGGTPSETDC